MSYLWSVFTKPWAELPGAELGRLVAGLGFAGAEVPVRDSAYVTTATVEAELPAFAKQLRAEGVEPISVASDLSEPVFAACAEAGVPMIRIMAPLGADSYADAVRRNRAQLEAAVALTERYDVQVGVQPHHGRFVTSTLGVLQLLDGLPDRFKLVWDAAHDALAGDDPAVTIELGADRLGIVNLKNARYVRADDGWKTHFGQGDEGLSDWDAVHAALTRIGFSGPVCLTGQYSDLSTPVEERVRKDLQTAVTSWGRPPSRE
ncbi:sugar phosphate isomerase/epimerase [Kribbella sandramycini]|uniref:Sugar phosphate isomerase/epimerase n=1 Tax=Kribbella sandramycini TaxID=60450 RepID=A0A7Y4KZR5_9ACTN|nr:sugar phosphate isomerase/epimerase family protein [Kribbella sandramycini]MBB6569242.1 sugar phosphate isomerase/epimerase [Kribbella sandramycini]NOL40917.1 sugar phosphate isomerase/epimerase [Kribbella sandramycini]